MNILIIGGTRFIGKALAQELKKTGVNFEITSRRENPDLPVDIQIICDREEFELVTENAKSYDIIFDFNGYKPNQYFGFKLKDKYSKYFFISTSWIGRDHIVADAENSESLRAGVLNKEEYSYIKNKIDCEKKVTEIFKSSAIILRLPIVLGEGDHHGRLDYLIYRIVNLKQIVIPEEGKNILDFILISDLVCMFTQLINKYRNQLPSTIDFIPLVENNYLNLLKEIFKSLGKKFEFYNITCDFFAKNLKETARSDPFWRECRNLSHGENAWSYFKKVPSEISMIVPHILNNLGISNIQLSAFIEERDFVVNRI